MKSRQLTPWVALVCGLMVQPAFASNLGVGKYASISKGAQDPGCVSPSFCDNYRPTYKLVWDSHLEKRYVTCYKTVSEQSSKTICKTCYKDEVKTIYKPCRETIVRTVEDTVLKPRYHTETFDQEYTVSRPVKKPASVKKPKPGAVPRSRRPSGRSNTMCVARSPSRVKRPSAIPFASP